MLRGEYGVIPQKSMAILVALGDNFGAERLVKITSAHLSGISYANIGDPGLDLLEDWASHGATVRVLTTINPCGIDIERWKEFGINTNFAEKQMRIINALEKMRTYKSLSCTPYIIGNLPKLGEHIAWAESSAIAYANSVLGARTNREGGPSALASAITGRTPEFGYHLEENRRPTHIIHTDGHSKGVLDYSALGYYVGERLGQSIPLFDGLKNPSVDELKALSAGLAASGSVALYHIRDVTPEEKHFKEEINEKIDVGKRELVETISRLSNEGTYKHICIGCPHCSLQEIAEISKNVAGKTLKTQLWVFTSRIVYEKSKLEGYVNHIEKAGGKVMCDTCMVVAPLREIGVEGIVTNSCKAAHYIPNTCKIPVTLKNLNKCVEVALGK